MPGGRQGTRWSSNTQPGARGDEDIKCSRTPASLLKILVSPEQKLQVRGVVTAVTFFFTNSFSRRREPRLILAHHHEYKVF